MGDHPNETIRLSLKHQAIKPPGGSGLWGEANQARPSSGISTQWRQFKHAIPAGLHGQRIQVIKGAIKNLIHPFRHCIPERAILHTEHGQRATMGQQISAQHQYRRPTNHLTLLAQKLPATRKTLKPLHALAEVLTNTISGQSEHGFRHRRHRWKSSPAWALRSETIPPIPSRLHAFQAETHRIAGTGDQRTHSLKAGQQISQWAVVAAGQMQHRSSMVKPPIRIITAHTRGCSTTWPSPRLNQQR